MNVSILVRAGWLVALGHGVLIPASVSAQPANTRLEARAEATIQISVSVAPRFTTSNRASAEGGIELNVASNAPGLRYKVIAQRPDMADDGPLQVLAGSTQPAKSSTLFLIVPD